MFIKAKVVDKSKAAAFDRGHFALSSRVALAELPKRSYYYEGERRDTEVDAARSGSSSSSVSSSRCSSPNTVDSQCRAAVSRPNQGSSESDGDMSDDEEVVRRARAATQVLFRSSRPASAAVSNFARCEGGGIAAPPNARLEKYLRGRTSFSLPIKQSGLTASAPTPCSRPTTVWGTSSSTEKNLSQPQKGDYHKSHIPEASSTPSDVSGVANNASIASRILPSALERALQWHTTNSEFQQLMTLLAQDVQREQHDDLPPAAVSVASPSAEKAWPQSLTSSSTTRPTSTRTYAPPSRAFAALEDKALDQLYEDWCLQRGRDDEEEGNGGHASGDTAAIASNVFIAADHRAAAFSVAAWTAHQSASTLLRQDSAAMSGVGTAASSHRVSDAPFTWEELLQSEVTRRNTRHAPAYGLGSSAMLSNPAALADQATRSLQRFLQSVACVERLVCDSRFMRSVAMFLYEHHKVFLPHYRLVATPPKAAQDAAISNEGEDLHADFSAHVGVEHSHAEHHVYEEFGERVSAALLSVLTYHVPGFDEAEFVEALYDTPATCVTTEDAGAASVDGPGFGGLQNVLSFPAWRLLLSMSGFESFFLWIMDYIYEEYDLDSGSEGDAPSVAVAGVRGLRALIRSTYNRPAATSADDMPDVDMQKGAVPPSATRQQETPLHTPSPPVSADTSDSLGPRPASEPQYSSLQPSPSTTRLSHTPPPSAMAALSVRASLLSSERGSGARLRKFFPTPPASAEKASGGLNDIGVPPYRRRETTHPGRDLPPITPKANSMMSASGNMTARFGELSSSASDVGSAPPPLRSERNLEQPSVASSTHASTFSTHAQAQAVHPLAPKTSTGVPLQVADASTAQRGGTTRGKPRFSSRPHTKAGTAQKQKPQIPRLNR
ncbi:hypothetical protein, conserved [Leishmania lindenbergi]|uniref:Uncharacterized protein n=1 Tax=Leishmania lindenbergi TaxID=651832 RepID=A0AAW3A153_9TRYP